MKSIRSWFIGLSRFGQITVVAVAAVLLLGGIATVSALTSPPPVETTQSDPPKKSEKKEPVITTKEETKTESIPYKKETIESNDLAKGKTQIQTLGVNGVKTITYTITLVDGKETNRTSIEAVNTNPINEVTVIGTYVEPAPNPNCDPNYSGCVPIAYDVDCGGGSGNGPEYIYGAVRVIGTDIYGLDRDGDGWGCE